MKKLLVGLTLASSLVLAACGGEETATEETTQDGMQDGSYRIEELNFGETGWKEALEITVAEGEITDANWESVNEDGLNKIEDDNYQETMVGTDGVGPQDFIPGLEDALVDRKSVV